MEETYPGGLYLEGGTNYYSVLALSSKVESVLMENSVFVPLSTITFAEAKYPKFDGGLNFYTRKLRLVPIILSGLFSTERGKGDLENKIID